MCQILQYVHVDLTITPNDFIIVSKWFANSMGHYKTLLGRPAISLGK